MNHPSTYRVQAQAPAIEPLQAAAASANELQPCRGPRRLHSTDLLIGDREIEIEHGDAVYRLRRTSLGKLILTK